MAQPAPQTSPPRNDDGGRHALARAMVWKRVLLWSSMIMMLAGAAVFATLIL